MEYWFPEHAVLINKSAYALALFGVCFCFIGALWYVRRHYLNNNLIGLATSGGFFQSLGGAFACASVIVHIGGPEPAPPLERLANLPANILLPTGLVFLVIGVVFSRIARANVKKARQDQETWLASFGPPPSKD